MQMQRVNGDSRIESGNDVSRSMFARRPLAGALLLCFMAQATGCGSTSGTFDSNASEQPTHEAVAAYSGEAIFRGLFFGEGEAVKVFADYWSSGAIKSAIDRVLLDPAAAEAADRALSRAGQADPEARKQWMKDHLEQMKDGRVALPTSESREKMASAIVGVIAQRDPSFFQRFAADMKSGDPQRVSTSFEGAKAQIGTALRDLGLAGSQSSGAEVNFSGVEVSVEVYAVTVAVVVLFLVVIDFVFTPEPQLQGSLAHDTFILDLARRLAPSAARTAE